MEVLFENRYVRDKEWAKDLSSYIYFCRPAIIAFDVFFLLSLLLYVILHDLFLLLLPMTWIFLLSFFYFKSVSITLKRDIEVHGKVIENRVSITNEHIIIENSIGSKIYLNYVDIKKAFQTKKYIYLQTKTKLLCSFKKDGFSMGNEEEFVEFLRNKGVKIK